MTFHLLILLLNDLPVTYEHTFSLNDNNLLNTTLQ